MKAIMVLLATVVALVIFGLTEIQAWDLPEEVETIITQPDGTETVRYCATDDSGRTYCYD